MRISMGEQAPIKIQTKYAGAELLTLIAPMLVEYEPEEREECDYEQRGICEEEETEEVKAVA